MEEKKETWTVTVQMTVFAGGMDKVEVMQNASRLLINLTDGTDFTGVTVTDAERDK